MVIVILFLTITVLVKVRGDLTIKPKDVNVIVGSPVRLNCSTNSSLPVAWHCSGACSPAPGELLHIYSAGRIDDRFVGDVSVEPASGGQYDLIIRSVTGSSAGVYTCADTAGVIGVSASATLAVYVVSTDPITVPPIAGL